MCFLPVGHTHEDIDQGFSCIARHLRHVNAYTFAQLVKCVQESFRKENKPPNVFQIGQTLIGSYLLSLLRSKPCHHGRTTTSTGSHGTHTTIKCRCITKNGINHLDISAIIQALLSKVSKLWSKKQGRTHQYGADMPGCCWEPRISPRSPQALHATLIFMKDKRPKVERKGKCENGALLKHIASIVHPCVPMADMSTEIAQ